MRSTRDAYGAILLELGKENRDIIVLDGDTSDANRAYLFSKTYPSRFFCLGIAEQNMAGVAAGLAFCGKIPFVSTFASFIPARALDSIKSLISVFNLNVKIISTHAGIATGPDGVSHQALEDIALMRAMPNFQVYEPADEVETKKLILAISRTRAPTYVRLCRLDSPAIFGDDYDFKLGKAAFVRDGKDCAVISSGIMVSESLEAAKMLEKEGLSVSVVDMHCIKPIDSETIVNLAKETKTIITVEDHNIIGGLGSAVAEVLAENNLHVRFKRVGLKDCYAESGQPRDLFEKYGLSANKIAIEIRSLFKDGQESKSGLFRS